MPAGFARQLGREANHIKRVKHAAYSTLWSGCRKAHGTMAELPGSDR